MDFTAQITGLPCRTIGTRSSFSRSYPTDENEEGIDEESTISQDNCTLSSANFSRRYIISTEMSHCQLIIYHRYTLQS